MAREDEHPDVLMARSFFHISKNIERIAVAFESIACSMEIMAEPVAIHTDPLSIPPAIHDKLWGRGADK